jgi:hypothetical protein
MKAKTGYPMVEAYSTRYSIEITVKEMVKILDKDEEMIADAKYGKTLFNLLDDLPHITWVDYNGMFGPAIYIELEKEGDNNKTWKTILDIICNYIK